jgi:hypothetical protein
MVHVALDVVLEVAISYWTRERHQGARRKYRISPEMIAPTMKRTTKGTQIKNVANSRISITADRMPVVRTAKMTPSDPGLAT